MNRAEAFLLEFHRRHPGCTRIAFSAGASLETGESSYELLSSLANQDSVLDIGCGDGHLLSLLAKRPNHRHPVGVDFSPDELAAARQRHADLIVAQAKAQSLPFAPCTFSLAVSHFAFHLMANLHVVVDELARVLTPTGRFAAIIGGGPKLGDTFESFLELLSERRRDDTRVPSIGERRGRTEEGLVELFTSHKGFRNELQISDHYIDFGGTFDEVWTRLSTVYDLAYVSAEETLDLREAFRASVANEHASHIPCTMAIRRVIAHRARDT